jgi:general secretion pathway protein J
MHPQPLKRYAKTIGFTLLEVLVALFIFTIIAIIMTHALRSVFDSQAATEQRAAQLAELQLAMLLMSRDMEQMIERPIKNAERQIEPALLGTLKRITFTHGGLSNPGGLLPRSTLQRTRYEMNKNNLLRQSWEVLDQVPTSKPNTRILLANVTALHFDYLDDENHYNDRWPPANKPKAPVFPKAVKMTLTLAYWGTITQVYLMPGSSLVTPKP